MTGVDCVPLRLALPPLAICRFVSLRVASCYLAVGARGSSTMARARSRRSKEAGRVCAVRESGPGTGRSECDRRRKRGTFEACWIVLPDGVRQMSERELGWRE